MRRPSREFSSSDVSLVGLGLSCKGSFNPCISLLAAWPGSMLTPGPGRSRKGAIDKPPYP